MKSVVTCILFALLFLAGVGPALAGDPSFARGRGFASGGFSAGGFSGGGFGGGFSGGSFGSSFRQESFSSSQFSAFDDGGGYCGGGGGFAFDTGFRSSRSFSFRQEQFSAPVFRPPVRQRVCAQFGFSAQFGRSRFGGCP